MILLFIFAGILGLAIGSFLNVVIYRVPAGRSIVVPASACPTCGSSIRTYDNVPVLSWLVLRAFSSQLSPYSSLPRFSRLQTPGALLVSFWCSLHSSFSRRSRWPSL